MMGNKQQGIELLPEVIFGAEENDGQENASGDSDESTGDSSKGEDGAAGSSSSDQSGSDEHDDANDPKTAGLKSALAAERKARKDEAKELKVLREEKEARELAAKSDVEREQIRADKASEKLTKLAAGYLKSATDTAIAKAAEKAGFLDTDDALAGVDRDSLGIEQDDEDPSIVTIDTKAVEKAIKALGLKKPHFLKTGTDDGDPTGSQFGGSKKKPKSEDAALKAKYPSLA